MCGFSDLFACHSPLSFVAISEKIKHQPPSHTHTHTYPSSACFAVRLNLMPNRTCFAPLQTADAADSSSQLETASETQIEDRRSKIKDRRSWEFWVYLFAVFMEGATATSVADIIYYSNGIISNLFIYRTNKLKYFTL